MATNRELRRDLLKKLGITPQALSLRVQKKKAQSPMSTEEATYLIAHDTGLRIDKYLAGDQVEKIRALHNGLRPHSTAAPNDKSARSRARGEPRQIKFPGNFSVANPILPPRKLAEAREMAAVYPFLYVLENSMREMIKRIMAEKFGTDWWDTQLTAGKVKGIHKTAADRMKTEASRLRWYQARGDHPIDYVDLGDLGDLILGKQEVFFPAIIGEDREWFIQFMKELGPSRNVLCHMNPLNKSNVADVKLKLQRWTTLLNNARDNIPPTTD